MGSLEKKNLMLIVPMLHQGGFERVCVKTARLLQDVYNVHILLFTKKDMHYDVSGLDVIDIDVPARDGKVNKVVNLIKRIGKVRRIKKDLHIDYSYSFGSSANYVNSLSGVGEVLLTGLRGQVDL
ncbi:MAG: glycosyltransferase, partial [Butyrivibrio sp.]|nr:glycosyltransferase [Butyrivibrio sp.]